MEQTKTFSPPLSRITVLDALRGFALLGVVITHMMQHYGLSYGDGTGVSLFPGFDPIARWILQNVIMGKFINIFAFLFGLSFFIQMDRAAQKGVDFRARFLWRMVVLFAIGIIGNCFYTGDILSIYALFGVLMVFLYRFKNWVLISIAALLLLGTPRIIDAQYKKMTRTEQVESVQSQNSIPNRESSRAAGVQRPVQQKPSFINGAKNNLTRGMQSKLNYQFGIFGRGYITLALFILGLIIGRSRFFEQVHINKRRNMVLLGWFATALIALYTVKALINVPVPSMRMFMGGGANIPFSAMISMSLDGILSVIFSGTVVLAFIALYQTGRGGKLLDVLSPYGRMGLTNYVMQSVIGAILFAMWGFGSIFGNWSPTEVMLLGVAVYIAQLIASKYWMKFFIYGPFEWFWRCATYLKMQPFRRK